MLDEKIAFYLNANMLARTKCKKKETPGEGSDHRHNFLIQMRKKIKLFKQWKECNTYFIFCPVFRRALLFIRVLQIVALFLYFSRGKKL